MSIGRRPALVLIPDLMGLFWITKSATRWTTYLSLNPRFDGAFLNYQEQGFLSRDDYLKLLAFDYDVDEDKVYELASIYGEEEDFDGLVTLIEDYVDIVDMFESLWTKNVLK